MHFGKLAVALLVATVTLSGCSDTGGGGTNTPVVVVPESAQEVEVTKTTGAIRGIVIDATITPISGVAVSLPGLQLATETAEDGGFVFNDLAPGDYFLSASKFGFSTIQTAVSVVAGVENPELVKISLPRLTNQTAAYANTQQWNGFITCAVSALVIAGNLCSNLDGGRFIFQFTLDSIPDYAQAEMIWKTTQTVTPKLNVGFHRGGTANWKGVQGISPLMVNATAEEIIGGRGEDATANPMRVFPPFFESGDPTQTAVTAVINQAFDVFLTHFYGFVPREGWLFRIEGPCQTYEQCGE